MQRVFLLHKGLKLTAKSIEVISAAVNGLSRKDRKFEIVDSLADASMVVVGDDIYSKRDLLTSDETEGLNVYPSSCLINAIKNHTRIMSPEEFDLWQREKEAEEKALSALPHYNPTAATSGGATSGPYDKSPTTYHPLLSDTTTTSRPENDVILEMLSEFKELYEVHGDTFRGRGYAKAYEWLMSYPECDLLTVEHIAPSVKEKIRELARTGKCQKLEALKASDKFYEWKRELCKIHGVGPTLADKWARKYKINSIPQLRESVKIGSIKLTEPQTIGLKYLEDFNQKIPRQEVEEMAQIVETTCTDLKWNFELHICGSYRRGKPFCGDADLIIFIKESGVESGVECGGKEGGGDHYSESDDGASDTHEHTTSGGGITTSGGDTTTTTGGKINRLVRRLQEAKFLLETIMISGSGSDSQLYLGVAKLKELARRIDIKIYPISVKPFALLQWSGGEQFVRATKIRASSLGYKLTDRGLYPVSSSGTREIIGPSLKAETEKDIFDLLQIPYNPENPYEQSAVGYGLQAIIQH